MLAFDPPCLGGSSLLEEIKKSLKEARRKKYALLSDFSYDLFMMKTSKSISKIFTSSKITDSQRCIQISTKVYIYMKLRREYFLQFLSTLANLIPTEESAIISCAYTQSKLMKCIPPEFLKKEFSSLINKQQNFPISLAYFAYTMIKESTNFVFFCIHEFIILINQIIFNSDQKVRLIAFDSLNMLLKILNDQPNPNLEQIINHLFFQAKEKMTSNTFQEQHGSYLILASIFQNLPHQIINQSLELFNVFISTINSPNLHSISLYNIVVLSRYDKDLFLKKYYGSIFDILYNDNSSNEVSYFHSYIFFIFYITFSEQVVSNESKLKEILENLIKYEETIKQAYQIIQHISINYSFFIQKNEHFFISLFQKSIRYSGEIVHEFVNLIDHYPTYFDLKKIGEVILEELDQNHSFKLIEFLSFCPFLNNTKIEEKLVSMLFNRDLSTEVRRFVPPALLRQLSFDDRTFVCDTFQKLFMLALSDPNKTIRLSVVESFNNDWCHKYLSLPVHLDHLTKLAHDEDSEVRNSAILLLGQISVFDPFNVDVILRSILLEHMFSIDVKNLRNTKSKFSSSLLPLIKSSWLIFPIYCSTFCDIALRELSNTPSEKLTYFEQKFYDNISINIIKSVRFIAKTEFSLLKSHLKQFVTFFIWKIHHEISKKIKLSVIKTLYVIMTKAGSIEDIDVSQLNLSLMNFAFKMNSKKINRYVLKIVGFIGVTSQKAETENCVEENVCDNLSSDPSYFISVVCQTLFEIINNCEFVSYHMSCLKALTVIFANDAQMAGQEYFSKFIMIVIEQVRLTNSSDYIFVLNQICRFSPYQWVLKYKSEIINVSQEILEKSDHSENILDFIPTLCDVFKSHAEIFYQNGISLLYSILNKYMKKEDGTQISLKCLNSIVAMRSVSLNFSFINVPKLLHILSIEKVVPPVKLKIVESLSFLFQFHEIDLSNFLPEIIRSLSDLLLKIECGNDRDFGEKVMQALFALMVKCGNDFMLFESQITFLVDSLKCVSDNDRSNYHKILSKPKPWSFNDFDFIIMYHAQDFQNICSPLNVNKTNITNESSSISNANNKNETEQNISDEAKTNINEKQVINNEKKQISKNETESKSDMNIENETKQHICNEISTINVDETEDKSNINNENDTNLLISRETKPVTCNDQNDLEKAGNLTETDNNLTDSNQSNNNEHESNVIVDEESIMKSIAIHEEEMESNDWKFWYKRLVSSFIEFSPSPFISSCSFLCDTLFAKAEQIFKPAFLSVWIFLTEKARLFVSETFTNSLQSDTLPKHVCSSIISLIEFLDRNDFLMSISKRTIITACEKNSIYTNTFYFASKWVTEEPLNIDANESIIRVSSYYDQLNMKKGLFKICQQKINNSNSPHLFEIIGDWSTACQMYEKDNYTNNFEHIMKCLYKEEKWDDIIEKIDVFRSIENKQKSSKFILSALYHRKKWDEMVDVFPFCPKKSIKVLSIMALFQNSQGQKKEAFSTIEEAFDVLACKSKGMINNDQTMINKIIIKSQQLHEILEIIHDEKANDKIWMKRIENLPKRYEFYNKILSVRLTKNSIESNLDHILTMLRCALKEERYDSFNSSLHHFFPDHSKWPISVAFLHCKSIWMKGDTKSSIDKIDSILKDPFYIPQIESNQSLKCKMYCTYAEWLFNSSSHTSIFFCVKQAVDLLEISMRTKIRTYKSFHYWAWCCLLMYMKAKNVKQHAVSALHGFLESIKLNHKKAPLDDLIQMVSLFFHCKFDEKSFDELSSRIGMLNDENFLKIIPQIFAQLKTDQKSQQSLFMANIVMKLLPNHYHVLLSNLLFDGDPNDLIKNVCNWFSKKNSKAFNECLTIKKGLVLCSSSSIERWQIDITKTIVSVQKNDLSLAVETLKKAVSKPQQPGESEKVEEFRSKIHQILTSIEKSLQSSTPELSPIQNGCIKRSKSNTDLKKQSTTIISDSKNSFLIEIVHQLKKLHSIIKEYLYNIQYLSMFNVAPDLFLLRNSIVAVPGTYDPFQPKIFIKQFDPTLEIYNSKQRPRFLVIYGDDGSRHKSLLKGREDLRLDLRLMQFFQLVNHHIKSKVNIFTYTITPITKKCGLIQFVEGSDTIFSLITNYRTLHSSNIFIEQTIENSIASQNVDSLRPIQRVEVLREADSLTNDDDLLKMIWINSENSKILMEKTIMFSETSAVMSVVGYILGIGDRHPSNILLHRKSGKVIHIDFGDCFEAAKRRKFFPELIPFRLTRMMKRTFGPSQIEGNFRIICERTLNLLRRHVYSLMSLLEIFILEPIENLFGSDPKKTVLCGSKKKKKSCIESIDDNSISQKCVCDDINVGNSYNYEDDDVDDNVSPNINECIKRVGEKIVGKDIDLVSEDNDNKDFYSIHDHVSFLIRNATDEYNLAYLYHGWTPLW